MTEQRFVLRPDDASRGWQVASNARDALRNAAVQARDSGQAQEVVIRPHKSKRSADQNRLMWMWLSEAEQHGDQTAEEYRCYVKLHIGVPLLRSESDHFRERYDAVVKGLDYATKLELMGEPFDFPVTRLMSVQQMSRFLEAMRADLVAQGIPLTTPEEAGLQW